VRTPFSNFSFWSLVWDLRRALFSEPLETWKRHGRTPYSRAIWGHGICTPDIVDLISEMSNIIDILQRKVGILTHKAIGMPDIRSGSTVKNAMKMLCFFWSLEHSCIKSNMDSSSANRFCCKRRTSPNFPQPQDFPWLWWVRMNESEINFWTNFWIKLVECQKLCRYRIGIASS